MASVYEGKNESTSLEPKVHPSGDCEIMTESDTGSGNLEEEASKCVQPSKVRKNSRLNLVSMHSFCTHSSCTQQTLNANLFDVRNRLARCGSSRRHAP